MQEQELHNPHRDKQRHPFSFWVRLFIALFVTLVIIVGTILWMIQQPQNIPLAVLTALGLLIAFSQMLLWLFPSLRHEQSTTSSQHPISNDQPILSSSPPSVQTSPPSIAGPPQHTIDTTIQHHEQLLLGTVMSGTWDDAPHITQFYGREHELAQLEQWIADDRCHLVAVLGFRGIGKTTLVAKLAEGIKDKFEHVFWFSLQNAPSLEDILKKTIQFFSQQERIDVPEDLDGQISLLLQYLRKKRCLLILDNFEAVLQTGKRAEYYRKGCEGYGKFIQRIGEGKHRSCILLTSREKLREIAHLEGEISPVRSLSLSGLEQEEGRNLLKDRDLFGSEKAWVDLISLYSGNPLALKLVSVRIRDLFEKNVDEFLKVLKEGKVGVGNIDKLLDQEFRRLSEPEREIMYWLAIEREAVTLETLLEDIVQHLSQRELLQYLELLLRRFMIESSGTALFKLQPVIMEYVTDSFIKRVSKEIETEQLRLFGKHALIKAQTKDYVRDSQVRLIITPIIEQLIAMQGKEDIEKKLKSILATLRRLPSQQPNYAVGNVLNLLIQLGSDLHGYDFSHLQISQAYLRGVVLPEINFAYSNFKKTAFTETFDGICTVVFSPNGDLVAAGTANGEIRLWQVTSGTPILTCKEPTDWVYSVAFSPDGKILASGSDDYNIRLRDTNTGHLLNTLQGHTSRVWSVTFSSDGKLLASGSEDQSIRLWEVSTGQSLKTLQGHAGPIRSVAFSPDGSMLACGSQDKSVWLWEVSTGLPLKKLEGHNDRVMSVAFSPDGSMLASGSGDQSVRLWEVSTGNLLNTLQGHTSRVWSVAFSPDGKLLAGSSQDRNVRLWEVTTGHLLYVLQGHTGWIRSIAFSPDGRTLASGSEDQSVRLWEVSTGNLIYNLQGYANRIWSVAFSPDGSRLASGNDDQSVQLWEVSTGQLLKRLEGHTGWVRSVAFSPDGKLLASGSDNYYVQLWDAESGQFFKKLRGHISRVTSVAFSPDGSMLASGGQDKYAFLWEVSTGQPLKRLEGHAGWIWSVAFSPNGKILASGSDDQSIRLWNTSTGQILETLEGHAGWIWSVAFGPDGVCSPVVVKTKVYGYGR